MSIYKLQAVFFSQIQKVNAKVASSESILKTANHPHIPTLIYPHPGLRDLCVQEEIGSVVCRHAV